MVIFNRFYENMYIPVSFNHLKFIFMLIGVYLSYIMKLGNGLK
ncbi:hypothetical protein SAMN05216179_1381 [Gracilibacillus kekensis]|uniref:Uncharacterized protein n=1 Tax=Gracilibacillus kekensis TaxID=1027249 RepID=A0A1M7MV42_9BACI|nr:hypothetical protein SAMN05216179_1381 [Gracilibacillus kekensis]